MSKDIGGFLGNLSAISKFFEEQEREQKEFSQYGDDEGNPYIKAEMHHFVHTEDDSVTQQMRGY